MRLRIESLAKGGDSVARDDGRVIFVDRGAPGDLVEVELVETKPRFARGVVSAIVEAGPERVDAPCRWAEQCGGCPWQSVRMTAQLAAKQQLVERALRGIAVEPIRPSPQDLGYRQRVTMHQRGGKVGFYARRSHELVAIDRCIALEPALDSTLVTVRAALPSIGEEGALRATIVAGRVLIALEAGRGAPPTLRESVARLVQDGVVAGASIDKETFGAQTLDAGGLHASASGFRQANDAQNDVLRELVREGLQVDGASLLELYCGDGNFTRDAPAATKVVAIEEDAAAIARLRTNAPGATAVCARVEREVQRRARSEEKWDRVLLDPPRAGAKEAMPSIRAIAPERIVYVSCDVATLARDLETLKDAYRIERVVPVDMMPHTDHVEVVAVLVRAD